MSEIISDVSGRVTEIRAKGVVDMGQTALSCNQEDLLGTVNKVVNGMSPARDWQGKFAANITITVELTGELEGNDGET